MKQAEDLDHIAVRCTHDAERHEITPLAALTGEVKRESPFRMSFRSLAPTAVGPEASSLSAAETAST